MSTDDQSAPDLAEWAEQALGVEVTPWQRHVLDHIPYERTSVEAFGGGHPTGMVLREFECCRALVWPSWAPGWVRCGSVVTGGRCERYGHESGDFPDFPGLHLADRLGAEENHHA